MLRRLPFAWALLLAVSGCVESEQHLTMVSPGAQGNTAYVLPRDPLKMKAAQSTQAEASRIAQLGQKILAANPHLKLHPAFITLGVEQEEVFHQDTNAVYVTEGLTRQCKTEAQLAAVLCMELGRMVAERERLAGPEMRIAGGQIPADVPVGDYQDMLGGPDRTRQMELYKYDRERRHPEAPPVPSADGLARDLLQKAGYAPTELDAVVGLLRTAEQHVALEQQFNGKAPTVEPVK